MIPKIQGDRQNAIPYTAVLARGLLEARVEPLLAFSRDLVRVADAVGDSKGLIYHGVSITQSIQLRLFLGNLLELLAKPAEGFFKMLDVLGCKQLQTLTSSSLAEQIARHVAEFKGIAVKKSSGGLFLSLVSAARKKIFLTRGRVPRTEAIVSFYNDRAIHAQGRRSLEGRVVFFAIEERRLRRAALMVDALKKIGVDAVIATVPQKKELRQAMQDLRAQGYECVNLCEFLALEEARRIAEKANFDSENVWHAIEQAASEKLAHRYLGVPIYKLFAPMFKAAWPGVTLEASLFVHSIAPLIEKERPSLVVLFDVGTQAMCLLQLCQKLGIKTSYYLYNPLLFTVDFWTPILLDSVHSDTLMTGTDFMKAKLCESGQYDPKDVFRIGDVLLNSGDKPDRAQIKARVLGPHGIRPTDQVVMAISGYVAQDLTIGKKRRFLTGIASAVQRIPGAKLIVKAHPNENLAELKQHLKEWGIEAPVMHTDSLKDLLHSSDLACMMFSQAGLEVVLSGTPLLIIQEPVMIAGYDAWMPFIAQGAASYVPDTDDPHDTIRALLLDESKRNQQIEAGRRFAERYISVLDGASDQHVVEAVQAILMRR